MDFKSKTVPVSYGAEKSQVRLQIWDTAGDEKYRNIAKVYYKGAQAICLVYDITSEKSFQALSFWVDQIKDTLEDE